jgi:hypothetical protein
MRGAGNIIAHIAFMGMGLRDLVGHFCNNHVRGGKQFLAEHFGSLHVQHIINMLFGVEVWDGFPLTPSRPETQQVFHTC